MDRDVPQQIAEVLRERLGVRESVSALVERFAERHPADAWEKILALDYETDTAALSAWFDEVVTEEPPPPPINALWFGLFTRVVDDGRSESALYVAGSERYGHDQQWMCSLPWWPRRRYAPSAVQSALRGLGYADGDEVGSLADYALTLTHAVTVARTIFDRPAIKSLVANRPSLAVAVGHDEGDGLLLGVLRSAGLDESDSGWI